MKFSIETQDNKHHVLIKHYQLENDQADYEIYWSYEPTVTVINGNKLTVFKKEDGQIKVNIDGGDKRLYFQLINRETGVITLLGHRRLPVPNMLNFRDLGGYQTTDGRTVKWGLLYRSDYFWNLAESGIPYVKNLHIKTNIDYRTDEEIALRPNQEIGFSRDVQCNTQAEIAKLAGEMQESDGSEETQRTLISKLVGKELSIAEAGDLEMLAEQRNYVTGDGPKEAFKRALNLIADTDNLPVNQHCRGGKDRTGYGVALTLYVLGVEESTIMADYMLTKFYRKERNEYLLKKYKEQYTDSEMVAYLYSFFDIKERFLQESIDEILRKYESVLAYIMTEFSITWEEIQQFRDYCLE